MNPDLPPLTPVPSPTVLFVRIKEYPDDETVFPELLYFLLQEVSSTTVFWKIPFSCPDIAVPKQQNIYILLIFIQSFQFIKQALIPILILRLNDVLQ